MVKAALPQQTAWGLAALSEAAMADDPVAEQEAQATAVGAPEDSVPGSSTGVASPLDDEAVPSQVVAPVKGFDDADGLVVEDDASDGASPDANASADAAGDAGSDETLDAAPSAAEPAEGEGAGAVEPADVVSDVGDASADAGNAHGSPSKPAVARNGGASGVRHDLQTPPSSRRHAVEWGEETAQQREERVHLSQRIDAWLETVPIGGREARCDR